MPVVQSTMPRSHSPLATARRRTGIVGIVAAGGGIRTEVDDLVAPLAEMLHEMLFQGHSPVIAGNGNFHFLFPP